MELTFQKTADRWVAEFEASADFNLHIEGVLEGNVSIFQRGTASGGYAYVKGATPSPSYSRCYDYDFTSLVYPKFIKVSCATEPTYAEVISSGEVTELKFQEKAVEITANGTHTIAPDAGFAALNAVSVKVNVPQGGGSASSWRYFDISKLDNSMKPMVMPFIVKVVSEYDKRITLPPVISDWTEVTAFGVDDSPKLYTTTSGLVSWSQTIAAEGLTPEVMVQVGIVEITKEEFYTL